MFRDDGNAGTVTRNRDPPQARPHDLTESRALFENGFVALCVAIVMKQNPTLVLRLQP